MPRTLLLEAGFVSLPQDILGNDIPELKDCIGNVLAQEKFEFSRIKTWLNANRIGILVEGLSDAQTESIKEVRGPKASVAYDLNNIPTPAATGFASAQGLEIKDLIVREVDGEKFLFARKLSKGQALEKCLARICETFFKAIPFACLPWSERSIFPQPLINYCAMLDRQVLDVELEGKKAGNEIVYFDGLKKKKFSVDDASSYPQVMKQLGIMAETSEKKKALDARIRAVLPEGYLIRHSRNKISRVCAFFENSQPLLVSFEKKYLEMPEIILSKVIADYFGYLICEDAHGKILPASVALPIAAKNSSDEAEIRSGFLNQELEKLWNIWNRDVHALPGKLEKISEQITDEGFVKTELFSDFNLMGIAESLCDFLGKSSEKALVSPIIRLIEEGEKTEIGRLLQGTGFSVIYNRLMGVDAFQPYAACLKEICQFFEERISVPENETSRIISLAILLHGYIEHVRCFDCSPERILSFLNCTGLKMDLFGCFHQLFPTHRFDRKCWFEAAFKVQSRESGLSVLFENLSGCSEFDPASFFAAYRDWKEISADELESFTGLVTRLRSKLNGINRIIDAQPDEGLETEISTGLTRIEKLPGVDYLAIYKFYQDEKVNIEACLMNLPAVLDDTSSELSSRISLLQRLQRQFSRLPLVKKEKRSEKI